MGFLWFWIVAVMIAAYVVFDGFDLGVGILYPFLPGVKIAALCFIRLALSGTAIRSGYWQPAALYSSLSLYSTHPHSAASIFP